MFENMHHKYCCQKAHKVSEESRVEICSCVTLEAKEKKKKFSIGNHSLHIDISTEMNRILPVVKSQKKSDKNSRNYNVSKAKHGKVASRQTFFKEILREYHCKQII